jgi:prophage maintenance system killer protein
MILTYNLSGNLRNELAQIDLLRKELLTIPISPKTELRLRWEATISKVYWSLTLSASSLSKEDTAKIIYSNDSKKLSQDEINALSYKDALDYINQEWKVNPRPLSINILSNLYDITCKSAVAKNIKLNRVRKELNMLFEYLHSSGEHPIIKAAIAQIQIIKLAPFENGNGRMARLIPYIYLYKSGYDFRGMLVLDEFYSRDIANLKLSIDSLDNNENLTLWLEYFTKNTREQLERTIDIAQSEKFSTNVPASYWKLNSRQKGILNILDAPGSKITNMEVQKKYNVSQITASRDLSKLYELQLLFMHGKGRSTYYTKI